MGIRLVEHRPRVERRATDRLSCTTKALVRATGVLALAMVALVVVTSPQLSDGRGWYEEVEAADEPASWTSKT